MTADPVTDPEVVIIVDPEMVPEMKDPGKVELGNLAEVEVLGVTAKSKESNNGHQTTVDPEGAMVVVEAGVMLPARIAVLNAEMIAEMIAGMIAGLHLCVVMTAVMTAVKTAGAVAEVGVAHPVLNPE